MTADHIRRDLKNKIYSDVKRRLTDCSESAVVVSDDINEVVRTVIELSMASMLPGAETVADAASEFFDKEEFTAVDGILISWMVFHHKLAFDDAAEMIIRFKKLSSGPLSKGVFQ